MGVLEKVYKRLRKNPNDNLNGIKIYHSDIYYVRAHLEEVFYPRKFTLEEIYNLLEEEDMLPTSGGDNKVHTKETD